MESHDLPSDVIKATIICAHSIYNNLALRSICLPSIHQSSSTYLDKPRVCYWHSKPNNRTQPKFIVKVFYDTSCQFRSHATPTYSLSSVIIFLIWCGLSSDICKCSVTTGLSHHMVLLVLICLYVVSIFILIHAFSILLSPKEQRHRLHGAASVDRHPLLHSVFDPCSYWRQLHHQVHDPLHWGGLFQPHLLHLHLWCHQEDDGFF